jgi:hypothetical protein
VGFREKVSATDAVIISQERIDYSGRTKSRFPVVPKKWRKAKERWEGASHGAI